MIKKLTRHGNSLALVIDRPVLDLLKIEADTPLEITTDGANLLITPVREDRVQEQIDAALDEGHARFDGMLKRLAG